jgi:uncharacterized protein YndB with AHSA1/START domain
VISRNGQRPRRLWPPQPDASGPDSESWARVLHSFKRHVEGEAMDARPVARAQVVVDATPEDAFRIFVDEIGHWWRQRTPYWNDAERGLFVRLEPGLGGRLIEVYDAEVGSGFEVGRVSVWEPGRRLGLTWTEAGWPKGVWTEVEVTFEPASAGTLVRVEHRGFERVVAAAEHVRLRYDGGWKALLGWFAERVTARR